MGIIDVHWFKDPNTQKSYLLWKENNWPFWPSEIYIRRIEENGITFRPEWPAKSILKAKFLDEWYCVEAPLLSNPVTENPQRPRQSTAKIKICHFFWA